MDARIVHEPEPEFGSGLRAHLGKRHAPPEIVAASVTVVEPTVPEPDAPSASDLAAAAEELERRTALLAAAEAELIERERRLAAEAEAVAKAAAEPPEDPRSAPEALRAKLERRIDLLWRAFEGALDATHADGRPDHTTRLEAARLLLLATAAHDAASDPTPAAAAKLESVEDELARLRDRRLEWGHGS